MAQDSTVRFKVEGDETVYSVDAASLTYGEMGAAEELFGCGYDDIPYASARYTQFLIALAIGREKPNFTSADAGDLRPDQIEFVEERPTKAKSPSGTKKSAPSSA